MSTSPSRVFAARLAGLPVFDPAGDQVGKIRDLVVVLRPGGLPPRVLGLVVIIAGLTTPWFGVTRAQATLNWVASAGPLLMRLDACVGMAMGGFLVYVFRAPTRRAP